VGWRQDLPDDNLRGWWWLTLENNPAVLLNRRLFDCVRLTLQTCKLGGGLSVSADSESRRPEYDQGKT
jgi:hypothetical protein